MKYHKMFCIDGDIAEKLKGINGSELVNSLLIAHFNAMKPRTKEDIQIALKKLEIEERALMEMEALDERL